MTRAGLKLLDIAGPKDAIPVSLARRGLGSSGPLSCCFLDEEPCATVV